jgi:hypothetical protein
MSLYDTDFYAWANTQAALLRSGRLAGADVEHIAEEIESMGHKERFTNNLHMESNVRSHEDPSIG